jgi:hypothetical protein
MKPKDENNLFGFIMIAAFVVCMWYTIVEVIKIIYKAVAGG